MSDQPAPDSEAPDPRSWLDAARSTSAMVIRIGGVGSMHLAVTFRDLMDDTFAGTSKQVLLDFSACSGVDSTFMGTLVQVTDRFRTAGRRVRLYNISPRCQEQLELLGVLAFLDMASDQPFPSDLAYTRLVPERASAARRLEQIREAHERLCELSEANRQRFGEFIATLGQELEEARRPPPPDPAED